MEISEILLMYVKAFFVGGLICAFGQILIMKTQLTSARILVGYVTAGVILGALGLYKPDKPKETPAEAADIDSDLEGDRS